MIGMELCLLGYLGYTSLEDVHSKMISILPGVLASAAALFFHGLMMLQQQEPVDLRIMLPAAAALLPGSILLLFAGLTKEAIGYGDGITLLVSGICIGGKNTLLLFIMGMLLTCPYTLGILLRKGRKAGNKEIPLVPFLLAGYILLLAMADRGLIWG